MKKISIAVLMLFFIFLVSSCSIVDELGDMIENVTGYYSNSNDLYSYIESKLFNGDVEFTVNNATGDDVALTYQQVIGKHPEFFWIGQSYSYETVTKGRKTSVNFRCTHSDLDTLDIKKAEFDAALNSVTAEAQKFTSEYEKALYVHDYIVDNTEYDKEIYDTLMSDDFRNYLYEAATAYGCLVNRKAICSGYAAAFQAVMQNLGIECGRISGQKTGEGPHEWNYIVLDGDYYYVDVTWDDPISDMGDANKSYQYFCVTTDEILQTHEIDNDQPFVPVCTANKYNYYIYNGMYLESYDFNAFSEIYRNHLNDRKISVKFSNTDELQNAKNDLIINQKIFQIASDKSKCNYGITGGGKILEFIME